MACRALGVNIINAILAPVAKPHNVIDFVIVRQFNSTLTLTVLSGKYRLSFGVCPLPAANTAHFQPQTLCHLRGRLAFIDQLLSLVQVKHLCCLVKYCLVKLALYRHLVNDTQWTFGRIDQQHGVLSG